MICNLAIQLVIKFAGYCPKENIINPPTYFTVKFSLRELAKKSTEPDLAKNAFDIKEYFRNWAAAVEIIIYCFK